MRSRPAYLTIGVALAVSLAFPLAVRTQNQDGNSQGSGSPPPREAFVQFAHLVTPAPGANTVEGAETHFLNPDDVTIRTGGTVTFIVNNGGHGLAIHRVASNTTRANIAADLCQGGANEADRTGRFAVCNNTIVTSTPGITGTQNLPYQITDGRNNLVIDVPVNTGSEPRVDDAHHSKRLVATSGRSNPCGPGQAPPACDDTAVAGNPAGAFLTGAVLPSTPGNRIAVRFAEAGRYLVICMNRAHLLNDHMFGFVNVVDGSNQQN